VGEGESDGGVRVGESVRVRMWVGEDVGEGEGEGEGV
jgi:hypothetical protein